MKRVEMQTGWPCQMCGLPKVAIRFALETALGPGLVELSPRGVFYYCARCDRGAWPKGCGHV